MKTTNKQQRELRPTAARTTGLAYASQYDRPTQPAPKNPVVRAGMSLVEMLIWIVVMAVLSLGMIVMLWNVSR